MNPKLILSLSILSAGLVLSRASLRADDVQPPPPQAPGADAGPSDAQTPPAHRRMHRPLSLAELTAKLGLTADEQKTIPVWVGGAVAIVGLGVVFAGASKSRG